MSLHAKVVLVGVLALIPTSCAKSVVTIKGTLHTVRDEDSRACPLAVQDVGGAIVDVSEEGGRSLARTTAGAAVITKRFPISGPTRDSPPSWACSAQATFQVSVPRAAAYDIVSSLPDGVRGFTELKISYERLADRGFRIDIGDGS